MRDICMIPTKELLQELDTRFEHYVFYGATKQRVESPKGTGHSLVHRYRGNVHLCMGYCSELSYILSSFVAKKKKESQK